ncbi:MAG: hypothetical protein ACP5ID_04960, partial [Conexivisphaera sp.]
GSNPTPSSTDCALLAAHMLESLLAECGAPGDRPGVRAPPVDPARCALVDLGLFGAIGLLRELLEIASGGGCEGAILAAAEVASYLSSRPELPEHVRRWAASIGPSAKDKGGSASLRVGR